MIRVFMAVLLAAMLVLTIACGDSERSPARSAPATATSSPAATASAEPGATPSPATSAPAATGTSTTSSGIQGQVLAGPQCPVVRQGSPCPDRPVSATIDVRTPDSDALVTTFSSGDDGRFQVALPPGDYVIVPLSPPSSALFSGAPQTVAVRGHEWTEVTISYDTGIR